MISHEEIEDGILAGLNHLLVESGGTVRTIKTTGTSTAQGAIDALIAMPNPAVLIMASKAAYGQLLAGGCQQAEHTIKILVASRSYRSSADAARGSDATDGVYPILKNIRLALNGRSLFGGTAGEMVQVAESAIADDSGFVCWSQEWKVLVF